MIVPVPVGDFLDQVSITCRSCGLAGARIDDSLPILNASRATATTALAAHWTSEFGPISPDSFRGSAAGWG